MSLRRPLALVLVFLIAFGVVTALRTCRSGGSLRSWWGGGEGSGGQHRPEKYTLPDRAPLEADEVAGLARLNDEYANLTRAVVPSVVSINTMGVKTERLMDIWGRTEVRRYPTQGQGSGVVVTQEGHVVTNHHVIAGQQEIQVTLHDGSTHSARLIGEDSLLDIAVIKIDAEGPFQPLKLGDSSRVQVGQLVFAVGNPFGLGETVTQGIISAKERSLSDNQRDLFQTDAAINPGNSGGPLVDLRGEIIGINVAIFSPDKENPGFQGVGFSIPSNDVRDALTQILERGRPVRGFLGVQMRDLDPAVRSALRYEGKAGAAILGVSPGSPAEAAGLRAWDVVVALDGEEIRSSSQLIARVQTSRVGSKIGLEVWRKGESLRMEVTVGESDDTGASPYAGGMPGDPEAVLKAVGVEVRDLGVRERLQGWRGVVVTAVTEDGLGAASLRAGDLVLAINGARFSGARDFYLHLAAAAAAGEARLTLVRDGRSLNTTLPQSR